MRWYAHDLSCMLSFSFSMISTSFARIIFSTVLPPLLDHTPPVIPPFSKMWSMSSNSKPFVSGKNAYTSGTHSAFVMANMIKTFQLMLAIAGGVISTTAKTHIQLKNDAMAEPRERIRVVVIWTFNELMSPRQVNGD